MPTITAIKTITSGSTAALILSMTISVDSSSESLMFLSIVSSSPLFSPTVTIWAIDGSMTPLSRKGVATSAPARILSLAWSIARFISVLPVTSPTTRNDSAILRPEPRSVDKVDAKRETTRCLISGPNTGSDNRNLSRIKAPRGVLKNRLIPHIAAIIPAITSTTHQLVII